ncbi:MAG: hypothetical protein NT113_19805 [Hyphomicrobiales bacterium]|nr:hypothetical protein [Hyphomicrobiales bacterium]
MSVIAGNLSKATLSPTLSARRIADRLKAMGHDPFYSDRERYLVLLEDRPGDIVELGQPLRGSRLFKASALARDIAMVRDIEAFATKFPEDDWLYWNIGLTGAKAPVGGLVKAYGEFNRLINIHFTEMRRRNKFELILLVIHPRYDPVSGRFDLHAHFICKIPPEQREAARRRLLTAFSKADVPDGSVRNAAACATYMIWGIAPPEETIALPDDALSDLWRLSRAKARLTRTGRSFGAWRHAQTACQEQDLPKQKRRTASSQPQSDQHDRLLAKTVATIKGKKVAALLYEKRRALSELDEVNLPTSAAVPSKDSSSATIDVTQDSLDYTIFDTAQVIDVSEADVPATATERAKDGGRWDGAKKLVRATTAVVARALRVSTVRLGEFARRLSRRCRGSP